MATESAEPIDADAPAFAGFRYDALGECLYWLLAACTGFISLLLAIWFPALFARLRYRACAASDADFFIATTDLGCELVAVEELAPQSALEMSSSNDGLFSFNRPAPLGTSFPLDRRMLVYRYVRYVYTGNGFSRLSHVTDRSVGELRASMQCGFSAQHREETLRRFGPNFLNVVIKPWLQIFADEVFQPFFVFQVYSVILWCFEEYFVFAFCIIILASVSVVSTLLETRANMTRISHMARFECQISVRGSSNNGDNWLRMSSSQLIPGDIVSIENDMLMPCDCALLDGACVVNEASLTGESVPVVKVAHNLSGRDDADRVSLLNSASTALHTLFASTRVLQVKPRGGGGNAAAPRVLAVVTRTGFDTAKGDLIISILFPRPSFFRFIQQSHRFIGALFVLALIGFFVTVWKLSSVGAPVSLVILRALDLMTTVVPPTLPLSMSVGINVATRWLARIGVFCTSPGRIAMAGKVKLVCFDKTGTLTAEGLEILGVHECNPNSINATGASSAHSSFEPTLTRAAHALSPVMLEALSCCHALTTIEDANAAHDNADSNRGQDESSARPLRLVGDPLELELFRFTQSRCEDSSCDTHIQSIYSSPFEAATAERSRAPPAFEFRIIERFEFTSELRRTSVIAERQAKKANMKQSGGNANERYLFVKGAPEAIHALCQASSLPHDFDAKLTEYAAHGFRVLAVAFRPLAVAPAAVASSSGARPHHSSFGAAAAADSAPASLSASHRAHLERALCFLGFVVMENRLKAATAGVVAELHEARVRQVMCTGDNILTAVSVARECGLVAPGTAVFVGSAVRAAKDQASSKPKQSVNWSLSDDASITLDPDTLHPMHSSSSTLQPSRFELALSGDAFQVLYDQHLAVFAEFTTIMAHSAGSDMRPAPDLSLPDSTASSTSADASSPLASASPSPSLPLLHSASYLDARQRVYLERSPFHRALIATQVFARMTPAQKATVVTELQALGLSCAMVGDGANDCAALKAAHVGVSLSESDASIAAPFTSTAQDITCVPALLREGRAALVTSFQLFRFMALYSIIQFCAVLLCFFRGSVFGNWQYFFQDLVIVFPITILMGATPTAERLTPKRPSGDLLSPRNVASTFGHMLICLGFQLAVYALPFQEPDFVDLQTPAQGPVTWHTTALYYASNLQMLMVAALFARGAPWKAEPHRNSRLFAWFAVCLSISLLLIAVSREGAGTFLWTDDACLPMHLRRLILLLMLLNAIVCFAYETLALPLAELALRSAPPHAATALGVGRHPALTARKPFHALRQAFEAGWSAARGSDRAVEVVTA